MCRYVLPQTAQKSWLSRICHIQHRPCAGVYMCVRERETTERERERERETKGEERRAKISLVEYSNSREAPPEALFPSAYHNNNIGEPTWNLWNLPPSYSFTYTESPTMWRDDSELTGACAGAGHGQCPICLKTPVASKREQLLVLRSGVLLCTDVRFGGKSKKGPLFCGHR